jgi:hypothetical protein
MHVQPRPSPGLFVLRTPMIFAIRWRTECFVVVHGLIESKSCSVFERDPHAHRNDAWNMSGGDRN